MRTAITGAAFVAALLIASAAASQGEKPQPLPVLPIFPTAVPSQPAVSSGTPPQAPSAVPSAVPQAPPPAVYKTRDTAHPDAPPTPPVPGVAPPPPPPAPMPAFTTDPSVTQVIKEPPLAGWQDGFFLRDPGDYFRLYPRGRLQVDFNSFPGSPTGNAQNGAPALQPRIFVRSLRFELAGQFFQNWTFLFSADFGGQAVSNPDGKTEQSAAPAGTDPTAATARYAPIQSVSANAPIQDAYINYSVCKCLNFMAGQQDVAFSMENQTAENTATYMARSIGVRSFAVPSKKELGLNVWGELLDGRLDYALQVLVGDGINRPQIDSQFDFAGRIFTRPFYGTKSTLEKLQLGVSARTGQRNSKLVGYDVSPLTTGQGYNLWQPAYKDSLGRALHILPSGSQNEIGGEFRLPLSIFDVRAEVYYVANNTREAVDGYQLATDKNGNTYTERLGAMTGVAWYVQASAWPLGDTFVNGDPGFYRPTTLRLAKEQSKIKRGLELTARIGGVSADYQGASRGGAPDPSTPTKESGSKITVYEYGFGANYWFTKYIRGTLNYTIYHTPDSGTAQNRAAVPANLGSKPDLKEHLLHELGARVGVWF